MKEFAKGKSGEDNLFDLIDPMKVNRHLQNLMSGLTIKVFRTYNASYLLNKCALLSFFKSRKDGEVGNR